MGIDSDMARAARKLCKEGSDPALAIGVCSPSSFTNEQPAHPVTLDGFWIDKYEVTNAQYRACVEDGACAQPVEAGSFTRIHYYDDPTYDSYPVVHVNWHMAAAYCTWTGAALPTEAQWEYSARGPEGLVFPWGNTFEQDKANYCDMHCEGVSDDTYDDGYPDTAPVGSYPIGASWVGALDLAGNVREWVADWYAYYPMDEALVNPTGPESGKSKIPRGGSWYDKPDDLRSTNRGENTPDYTRHKVGFRCASH